MIYLLPPVVRVFALVLTAGCFGAVRTVPAQIAPATETAHTDAQGPAHRAARHVLHARIRLGPHGKRRGRIPARHGGASGVGQPRGAHADRQRRPRQRGTPAGQADQRPGHRGAGPGEGQRQPGHGSPRSSGKQSEDYQKYQKEVADYTAKDLEKREKEIRDANTREYEQRSTNQPAQTTPAPVPAPATMGTTIRAVTGTAARSGISST